MIDKTLETQILRYHFVEQWGVHTIARQLHVHHSTVERVLSQAGMPRIARAAGPPTRTAAGPGQWNTS